MPYFLYHRIEIFFCWFCFVYWVLKFWKDWPNFQYHKIVKVITNSMMSLLSCLFYLLFCFVLFLGVQNFWKNSPNFPYHKIGKVRKKKTVVGLFLCCFVFGGGEKYAVGHQFLFSWNFQCYFRRFCVLWCSVAAAAPQSHERKRARCKPSCCWCA